MVIDAGELNKRIEILKKTETRGTSGHVSSTSYTVVRRTWASFRRQTIKEISQAGGDFGKVTVRFVVRSSGDISRHMFVRYAGELYAIEGVNDYNDNREYTEISAVLTTLGG